MQVKSLLQIGLPQCSFATCSWQNAQNDRVTVQNSLKPQTKTSKTAKPIQTNLKPAAKSGYLAYNQVQLALDRPKTLKIWLKNT